MFRSIIPTLIEFYLFFLFCFVLLHVILFLHIVSPGPQTAAGCAGVQIAARSQQLAIRNPKPGTERPFLPSKLLGATWLRKPPKIFWPLGSLSLASHCKPLPAMWRPPNMSGQLKPLKPPFLLATSNVEASQTAAGCVRCCEVAARSGQLAIVK